MERAVPRLGLVSVSPLLIIPPSRHGFRVPLRGPGMTKNLGRFLRQMEPCCSPRSIPDFRHSGEAKPNPESRAVKNEVFASRSAAANSAKPAISAQSPSSHLWIPGSASPPRNDESGGHCLSPKWERTRFLRFGSCQALEIAGEGVRRCRQIWRRFGCSNRRS